MLIPSFSSFHQTITDNSSTNDFFQEEQPVVPNEQRQPQEHERVRWQPARNRQPPRYGTGGHRRH